jgi:glutaminyl-tRNA synthetase
MPTISGMRRRGFTPASLRTFCDKIGIAKRENLIEFSLLEFCVRDDLNQNAARVMAVLDPLKIVITNYDAHKTEILNIENNPEKPETRTREVPFCNEIYIERDDFMENPPKKYFRLFVGGKVRLKGAYIIQCNDFVKNDNGDIIQLNCSYIENSKSGNDTSGIVVKGTIHWVSANHAKKAQINLYDRLFTVENPAAETDFKSTINPKSLTIIENALIEPHLANAKIGENFQFLRKGYFCVDTDSTENNLIFNQTVTLKDTWAKEQAK